LEHLFANIIEYNDKKFQILMEGGSCDLGHYAKLKYQAKEKFTKEEI
jgi:hypothetical protein